MTDLAVVIKQLLNRRCNEPTALGEEQGVVQANVDRALYFEVAVPPWAQGCGVQSCSGNRICLRSPDDTMHEVAVHITACNKGSPATTADVKIQWPEEGLEGGGPLKFSLDRLLNAWTRSFAITWSTSGAVRARATPEIKSADKRPRRSRLRTSGARRARARNVCAGA